MLIHALIQIAVLEAIPTRLLIETLIPLEEVIIETEVRIITLAEILQDILEIEAVCLIPMDMETLTLIRTEEVTIEVEAPIVDVLITTLLTTTDLVVLAAAVTIGAILVVLAAEEEATTEVVRPVVQVAHLVKVVAHPAAQVVVLEEEGRFLNKL